MSHAFEPGWVIAGVSIVARQLARELASAAHATKAIGEARTEQERAYWSERLREAHEGASESLRVIVQAHGGKVVPS